MSWVLKIPFNVILQAIYVSINPFFMLLLTLKALVKFPIP